MGFFSDTTSKTVQGLTTAVGWFGAPINGPTVSADQALAAIDKGPVDYEQPAVAAQTARKWSPLVLVAVVVIGVILWRRGAR